MKLMHKFSIALLIPVVVLGFSACSSGQSPTGTPVGETTSISIATATSTEIPVSPTATETYSPAFVRLQEQIGANTDFTLNSDGTITVTKDGGEAVTIQGITVNPDGSMVLETGEGLVSCTFDPATIKENTFQVTDENGDTWVWDGTKLTNEVSAIDLESVLDINYENLGSDLVESSSKMVVSGGFRVDRSANSLAVHEIPVTQQFLAKFIAMQAGYYVWSHGPNPVTDKDPSAADLLKIEKQMAEFQSGGGDINDVLVNAPFFDLSAPDQGYQDQQVVFFPVARELPEGTRAIKEIQTVYVKGHEVVNNIDGTISFVPRSDLPGLVMTSGSGRGYGAVMKGETLILYVGPAYAQMPTVNKQKTETAGNTYLVLEFIKRFKGRKFTLKMANRFLPNAQKLIANGFESN